VNSWGGEKRTELFIRLNSTVSQDKHEEKQFQEGPNQMKNPGSKRGKEAWEDMKKKTRQQTGAGSLVLWRERA